MTVNLTLFESSLPLLISYNTLEFFFRPCGEPCAQYLRGAFSVFPGIEALVAFLIVALLYRPSSKKNLKRRMTSKCLQIDVLVEKGQSAPRYGLSQPVTSFHMIDFKVFSGPNAEPVGVIVPGSKLIFTRSCYLGCHAKLN